MVNYNEHATTVDPWESNTYLRLVTVRKCSHTTALILIPPLAAARLQRWALQLSARFSFIPQRLTQMLMCYHIFHFSIQTIRNNQKLTFLLFDRLKLYPSHQHNSNMWQDVTPLWAKCTLCKASSGTLKPYWNSWTEQTLEDDCVMWGIRLEIPAKLQEQVLQELHGVYLGISKTKTLARSHVWWPGIHSK